MNTYTQILRKYESDLRDAIRNRDQEAGQSLAQALELKENIDWSFICTALDVIGDTTCAIQHFLEAGLDGSSVGTEVGGQYLRLYGVLNSTYLQQEAIDVLYQKIIPNDKKDTKALNKNLKIREIRNKIGSHSSNSNYGKESYVVIRNTLSKFSFEFINNHSQEPEWVNLKESLEEHLKLILYLFDHLYEQIIQVLYKKNKTRLKKELDNLSSLRTMGFLPYNS